MFGSSKQQDCSSWSFINLLSEYFIVLELHIFSEDPINQAFKSFINLKFL